MVVGVAVTDVVLLLSLKIMQVFDLMPVSIMCQQLMVVELVVVMVMVAGCFDGGSWSG